MGECRDVAVLFCSVMPLRTLQSRVRVVQASKAAEEVHDAALDVAAGSLEGVSGGRPPGERHNRG
jgi:hypothetical protein